MTISGILAGGIEGSYDQTLYTVSSSSLKDITSTISSKGTISAKFAANRSVIEYVIYAAYYELSGERACIAGPAPSTFLQNGSFVVDHFSARGAQVTTDFLEEYVLINGVQDLMQQIEGYRESSSPSNSWSELC